MFTLIRTAFVAVLAVTLASSAHAEGPSKDPRNWPTLSRLQVDRYEVAGQVFTYRVHAKKTDYFNCGYSGEQRRLMAFTLLGGPMETVTGYVPRELGVVLERLLESDPWAQITVDVRYNPDKLSELCPDQVDILKWSRGWRYTAKSLSPVKPDTARQSTRSRLAVRGQRAIWKELRRLDSPYIGQRVQLTAGARVSTAYMCAFRGSTRGYFALRLHDGAGRFVHAYVKRDPTNRRLVDHVALHRDVPVAIQARVVKQALSSYCRPQLEILSWNLLEP